MAQRLREAPGRVHEDVAREVERGVAAQLAHQFDTATDPTGQAWQPPKDGHRPPMVRTGALRRGFTVVATSTSTGVRLSVSNTREYAKYLQSGTRRMSPRRVVPGLTLSSEAWRETIRRAYADAISRWYGSGA